MNPVLEVSTLGTQFRPADNHAHYIISFSKNSGYICSVVLSVEGNCGHGPAQVIDGRSSTHAIAEGGGRVRCYLATWLPSQNGLLPDLPHRQRVSLFLTV